jgi:ParB-like chromosome segregation protein Spo0J
VNIIEADPHSLIPYANNSKKHPKEQIDKIARQISSVGFTQPVIVDKDNVIIIGHGRTLAALALNLEKIPVIVRDDLTEEQCKALRIADNKVAESEWDTDFLKFEIGSLDRLGFDLALTGFELDEIHSILNANDVKLDEPLDIESNKKHILEITLPDKDQLDLLYNNLVSDGYIVRIK